MGKVKRGGVWAILGCYFAKKVWFFGISKDPTTSKITLKNCVAGE